jgi:hypothetical protein
MKIIRGSGKKRKEMSYDKEIKDILEGRQSVLTSYNMENIEFLKGLEQAYNELEQYEVSSIIRDRISILTNKEKLNNTLDEFNNKINMIKEINKNN